MIGSLFIGIGCAHGFSWDSAKERQALELVRQFQARHHVPSIALSVAVNGSTVLAKGLAADGSVAPDGENVRYRIGSVTKQFTAAAVLALIEDRAIVPGIQSPLTVDTLLSDIFPGQLDPQSDAGKISVHRLLTMTSNIPNFTDDPFEFSADASGVAPASRALSALEIIPHLKTYRLVGAPMTFEYSNTNYFILALIIHVMNGGGYQPGLVPVQSYVHRRVLAKAAMAGTGFVGEASPAGTSDAAANFLYSRHFDQGSWPKGAGDLVSTAADMARWNVALMAGSVLNKSSVELSLTPVAQVTKSELYGGCRYAMGWYVCDKPGYRLYQHDGAISGFMASNAIGRRPDGSWIGVTVLGNIDATTDIVALARSIVELGN